MDTLCEVEHAMTGTPDAGRRQFALVPSATGVIARLAYARAKKAGITLPPLLSQSGLTVAEIENRHLRLKVKGQIAFLGLVADALGDNLLGFHLARDFDLREIGPLYYVMTSAGMPHGKAHAGEISRKLGMSERTLARRLSREGLTLTRVLDELKLELAKRHLQDGDLTISGIAWLLGYREASAFTHAFHRRHFRGTGHGKENDDQVEIPGR
jgi:AraC-like DNA-binding protein